MTGPAPVHLSDDMAAAIGHAVSAFGYLEESLKRAIFSLTLSSLGPEAGHQAMTRWQRRMADIADDTLGTLIDSFVAAAADTGLSDPDLESDLRIVRLRRNLLCHASWRPGRLPGHWYPAHVDARGERHPDDMDPAAVLAVHADALRAAERVLTVMKATGIDGEWPGHGRGDP